MEFIIIVSLVMGVLILHRTLSALFNKFYISRQQRKFIETKPFTTALFPNISVFITDWAWKISVSFFSALSFLKKPGSFHYIEVKGKCGNAHPDQCGGRSAHFRSG